MPDYITHLNNRIKEKYRSVPPSIMEGKVNVLEITRAEMDLLEKSRFYLVDNRRIRPMTTTEIDALLAEESATALVEENARLTEIDNEISITNPADFSLAQIDATIDVITDIKDIKLFLKKLVHYVAKNLNH